MSDDLKVLFPGADVEVGGESFSLRPFPFGKVPKVISLLGDVLHLVMNTPPEVFEAINSGEENWQLRPDVITYFTTLIELGGSNIFKLLALVVDRPVEWVEKLDMAEGLELCIAVYSVNSDFFTKRFIPAFNKLMSNVKGSETLKMLLQDGAK